MVNKDKSKHSDSHEGSVHSEHEGNWWDFKGKSGDIFLSFVACIVFICIVLFILVVCCCPHKVV
jgi:hypothetical protein